MPTKPVIMYKGPNIPIALSENASIVRKRVGSSYENWSDRTELVNYVDQLYVHPTSDTYMYIVCGCGEDYEYTLKADVPSSNVVCSCGRNVITYGS